MIEDLGPLQPRHRIALIPHVTAANSPDTGDAAAHTKLVAELPDAQRRRVLAIPGIYDAAETKWIIGKCHWFCGTRMHACIAALSQGVAATAIAYSDKTLGVFESAGVAGQVVDPRSCDGEAATRQIMRGLEQAGQTRDQLQLAAAQVRQRLDCQFEQIVSFLIRTKRGS